MMKYAKALIEYLATDKSALNIMKRHNVSLGEISPTSLPPQYDDAHFEGVRVGKNGEFCRTVGEYKKSFGNIPNGYRTD